MSQPILTVILVLLCAFFFYRMWKRNKAAKANASLGADYLKENAGKEGIQTTASGLQYLVLQAGTGEVHPALSSRVKVHYHGTLIDGTVFDSSVERAKPITFGVKQVIKGWQEGL